MNRKLRQCSDNVGSGKKWSGGYGAHVVAGERYEIIEETKPEETV